MNSRRFYARSRLLSTDTKYFIYMHLFTTEPSIAILLLLLLQTRALQARSQLFSW